MQGVIWVLPPVTDTVLKHIPPGVYHQVDRQQWGILTLDDVVFSNVALMWVQLTEQSEWITLPQYPMVWVWWNRGVSPPCLAMIVPAGGYSYEVRREGEKEFFVLTRQEYFLEVPPVAVAVRTRARGYRKQERRDVAAPLLPRGLNREDVERYFRGIWGNRVERVTVSGNRATVYWTPDQSRGGNPIETVLEYRDGRWHVISAGFCVSGMDSMLPASVLPQLYRISPGQRAFWVEGL